MASAPDTSGKVSYRQQYRRCGKEGCSRCRPGSPGHGPYWYASWWADGRMHSRYVGKHLPAGAESAEESASTDLGGPASGAEVDESHAPSITATPSPILLRVRTLGGFAVWMGEAPIPDAAWSRRKVVTALFKQLLSAPGCRVPREALMESLWPDATPSAANANLRYTIHLLRKLIDPPAAPSSCLRTEGDLLVLAPNPGHSVEDWLDAAGFATAARQAIASASLEACAAALGLYQGDFLPEDLYAEWAEPRRRELRNLRLSVLQQQADLFRQAGDLAAAQRSLTEVLEADPCHEAAARTLMRMQAASGRRTDALATYRRLAAALDHDLDVEPEAETRLLYADLLAGRLSRGPAAGAPIPAAPSRAMTVEAEAGSAVQPPLEPLTPPAPNVPLLSRTEELAILLKALDTASAGRTTMALVHGPAGIGKSRLLTAFLEAARDRGALALAGRAYFSEGQLPYGPLQQALRAYVAAQPAAILAEQAAYHTVLVRLVPELGRFMPSLPSPTPLEPKAERHRLFAAISDLLGALGKQRPVVLVLEDLHWADRTTLQVLHYLLRSGGAAHLLIVCSYRSDEVSVGGPLDQLLAALRGADAVVSVQLDPLPTESLAALVCALLAPQPVAPGLLTLLGEKTLGNPLYAVELVAALRQAGNIFLDNGIWQVSLEAALPIPSGMNTLFQDRVRRLGEESAALARLCAVAGQHATYPLLRMATDLSETALLDALEELLESRVLAELATPAEAGFPAYTLVHPLLHEAIYQQIPAPRRIYLHRRTAEALEARHTAPARAHAVALSWHFAQAGASDAAAYYAVAAGDQAARTLALPEALADYQAAQAHMARMTGPANARYSLPPPGKLDERQGEILLILGRYEDAQARFATARAAVADPHHRLELARKEATAWERRGAFAHARAVLAAAETEAATAGILTPSVRASVLLSNGSLAYQRGDYEEAANLAAAALSLATGDDDQLIARLHQLIGNIAIQQQRVADAELHYREALAIWERHAAEPRTQQDLARSWLGLGTVNLQRGEYAQAEESFRTALAINERIGSVAGVAAVLNNLGNVAFARGEYAAADDYYRRSLALWEQIGDLYLAGYAWNNLGGVAMALGNLAQARSYYERGLAVQEQTGSPAGCATAWQNLGDVALAMGDLPGAEALYVRAITLIAELPGHEAAAGATIGRASVARLGGDPLTGLALARPARREARARHLPAIEAAAALEMACCYRDRGRLRHATAALACCSAIASRHGLARVTLQATLVAAELALARQAMDEAAALVGEALRTARAAGCRIEEARANYVEGCLALRGGKAEQVVGTLRHAAQGLRDLGCMLAAARAEAALAAALRVRASHGDEEEAARIMAAAQATAAACGAPVPTL